MKRKPEEFELLQEWLYYAKENLLFARAGLKENFSPFNTICFLCQGSAEKYLKGYLVFNGWKLEKIHDLAKLLGYAAGYDSDFATLKPFAKTLNEYITEGRYPGDLRFKVLVRKMLEKQSKLRSKSKHLSWRKSGRWMKPAPILTTMIDK